MLIKILKSQECKYCVLLTNEQCTKQLEQTQNLPMAKCTPEQHKLPQLSNKAMEEQSTHFICKTHQEYF